MDKFPATIAAGATLDVTLSSAQYPAPAWALTLCLRGAAQIDIESTTSGKSHRFFTESTTTKTWAAGEYLYQLTASNGTTSVRIDAGKIKIERDLSAIDAAIDTRSHAQIVLDNISAVLEKRATQDQQKYTINNRELWRTPLPDLLKLKNQYAALVRNEKRLTSGQLFGRARVSF